MLTLKVGTKATAKTIVSDKNTAQAMKSGSLPVFATPAMVALMEEASCLTIKDYLEIGEGTVGIALNIEHVAPTALNDTVTATATLSQIDGRKLVFTVEVHDTHKLIGKGTHERFLINNEKFMSKL